MNKTEKDIFLDGVMLKYFGNYVYMRKDGEDTIYYKEITKSGVTFSIFARFSRDGDLLGAILFKDDIAVFADCLPFALTIDIIVRELEKNHFLFPYHNTNKGGLNHENI